LLRDIERGNGPDLPKCPEAPMTTFLSTTIPYVNAVPHIGFALEAVQADVLARHRRQRGEPVRLLSGTDDNSLKNVLAAEAAGLDVGAFVDANAGRFAALAGPLSLTYDDFIRTSRDPRHRVGVEALWRANAAAGDLYQASYDGLYCIGCEHYLTPDELDPAVYVGRAPEQVDEFLDQVIPDMMREIEAVAAAAAPAEVKV